jgi:L-malate glycosyltransferase
MKVYLFNRGRDKNIGDTLISEVICHFLHQEGCEVIVNPDYPLQKGKFRAIKIHFESYLQDIINIVRADITVIGGGNLIMDSSKFGPRWAIHHFWLSLLNLLLGKKYYYLCVGVAPLKTSLAKLLYRFVLRQATKISVRDTFSQKYIKELSGRYDILLWFDPVLLVSSIYPPKPPNLSDTPNIGICPIQLYPVLCPDIQVYQKYVTLHVKLIEYFLSENHHVHLFLNDPAKDKQVYADIIQQLPIVDAAKIRRYEKMSDHVEYLKLIQNLDFLISSRMHAVITATSYQRPTIGYGWQPKMQYFYQDQNLEGHIAILDKLLTVTSLDEIVIETINLYQKLQGKFPPMTKQVLNLEGFLNLGKDIV